LLQIDPTMLLEPFNLQTFVEDRTMDNQKLEALLKLKDLLVLRQRNVELKLSF